MPHREVDIRSCSNFFQSLAGAIGFGITRSEKLTFNTLLLASTANSYVEGSSLLTGACGQTVRNHLSDKNPDGLLQANHDLIATLREMGVLKKTLMVALDWHDEMYYGDLDTEGIIGTKNNRGTNYAYEYATVSIVVKGIRFVIAVIPVRKRSILEMVRSAVSIVGVLGIRIRILLMDGGFFSTDAINYLISNNVMFIMHVPKMEKGCEYSEVDRLYTTSGHKKKKGYQATFRLVSIYGKDRNGKMILYAFATNTTLPPISIFRIFKKRWGIETGYRMVRKFLAKTTSRRYKIRLLYFYLAVLLYNFWVLLNLKSRRRIIADVLRILTTSILVTVNPFSTNLCLENKASGGDF